MLRYPGTRMFHAPGYLHADICWRRKVKKALVWGILGSFFFAFTFVLNRSMNLSGGYWLWSAVLRYLFTLPMMFALLVRGRRYLPVLEDIRKRPCEWILCGTAALLKDGIPSGGQTVQSVCVALFSGVIATVLFFGATDMVKDNPRQLAVIEATQSGEVIFTLLLGILVLHDSIPSATSFLGILLIVAGMILNSLASA